MEKLVNCKHCGGKPELRRGCYRCSVCGRGPQSDAPIIYSPYSMGEGILMARYNWNKMNTTEGK